MKFPNGSLLLACFVLPASAVWGQRLTLCTPTKQQVIVRQRIAEMDAAEGRLNPQALRDEAQQLRRENKIDDQQLAGFMQIVQKAEAARPPAETATARAAAAAALDAKMKDLDKPSLPQPVADTDAQVKAQRALQAKLAELQKEQATQAAVAAAKTPPVDAQARAQQALDAKMAELNAHAAPAPVSAGDARAKAEQALAAKMAELQKPTAPAAATPDRSAAEQALAAKMAELDRTSAKPQPTVVPAVAIVKPAPAPAPVPSVAPAPAPAPTPAPVAATKPAPQPVSSPVATAPTVSAADQQRIQNALSQALAGATLKPSDLQGLPASVRTGLDRLAELTELYRASKITPAEYHAERAKVVKSLAQ